MAFINFQRAVVVEFSRAFLIDTADGEARHPGTEAHLELYGREHMAEGHGHHGPQSAVHLAAVARNIDGAECALAA